MSFYDRLGSKDDKNPYTQNNSTPSKSKGTFYDNLGAKNDFNPYHVKAQDEFIPAAPQATTNVQGFTPTISPNFKEGGEIRNQTIGEKVLHNPVYKTVSGISAGLESGIGLKYLRGLIDPEQEKYMESTRQANPKSAMVGEVAGLAAPFSAVGKGLKAIPYIGKAFQASSKLTPLGKALQAGVTAGVEGQIVGRAKGALDEATREIGLSDLVSGNDKRDIWGASNKLGNEYGLGGLVLGGLGAAAINKFQNIKSLGRAMESVDNYQIPQLRDLRESTKPMLNNRGVELSPFKRDLPKNIAPSMKSVNVADDLKPLNNDVNMNSPLEVRSPLKSTTVENTANMQNATWKNKDFDQPVEIIGEAGTFDGKKYYNVKGSNSAIPEDEIIFNNKTQAPEINTPQQTPKSNFDHIKTIDDLPNDLPTLEAFVKEIQAKKDSGLQLLDIDLQLFAKAQEKLQRMSNIQTVSGRKADFLQGEDAQKMVDDLNEMHDIKTNKDSMLKADEMLSSDYEGTVKRLMRDGANSAEETAATGIIGRRLKEEAVSTNDYSKLRKFIKAIRPNFTNIGQTIQALRTWQPKTAESMVMKAQKVSDKIGDDILKQNPKIDNIVKAETTATEQLTQSIKKESEKVIDEVVGQIEKAKTPNIAGETSFPKMLQDKISSALNPKAPADRSFIKDLINDLFSQSKETVPFPKPPKLNNDIQKLGESYNFRNYKGEIRTKAQDLLKEEFKDSPEVLAMLDDYFSKGFKPPHSEKLLNDVLNKRLGGLNAGTATTAIPSNKPNLKDWVKDWYGSGGQARVDFVKGLVDEVGLTGEEAASFKRLLDSKLHNATKDTKEKLMQLLMAEKKPTITKAATTKLKEFVNIGGINNEKFANRISEKVSPMIQQLMRENKIDLGNLVRLSQQDKNAALVALRNDIKLNTNISDFDLRKLIDITNAEFKSLSIGKQKQILEGLAKPPNPVTKKTSIENIREKINLGLYGDDIEGALQDAVKERHGLPTLSNDEVKFIVETMDSVKGLPERSQAYLEGMAKVQKLINEKSGTSLSQKSASAAFSSLLLNTTSGMVNVGANLLQALPEIGFNPLGRAIDKGLSRYGNIPGQRAIGKINPKTMYEGAKAGLKGTGRDFLGGRNLGDLKDKSAKEIYDILANPINTDISNLKHGDKFEQVGQLAFKNNPMRIIENLTGTYMKGGDRPFFQAYYDDAVEGIIKANEHLSVKPSMAEIEATATQRASERTYKDLNILSEGIMELKNLPKTVQVRMGIDPAQLEGMRAVFAEAIPAVWESQIRFAKTPANILKRIQEYSPLGIAEGVAKFKLNKGNMTLPKQAEIGDRLKRGIIGTGMFGGGVGLAAAGLLTNKRDKNSKFETLNSQAGNQPDSLNIAGKNIDLKRGLPFTAPIIAGGRVYNGDSKGLLNTGIESATASIDMFGEMGLMQNVQKLIGNKYGDDETAGEKIVAALMELPKQWIPAQLNKLANWKDPYERNLKSDDKIKQNLINPILNKMPFTSELLPAKVDYKGDPIKRYQGNNTFLNTQFNPIKITTKVTDDNVLLESLRLFGGSKDTSVLLPVVTDKIKGVELTPQQKNEYQKITGTKVQSEIQQILSNQNYNGMSDEEKTVGFVAALGEAKNSAEMEMLKKLGIDTNKIKQDNQIKSYEKDITKYKLGIFRKPQ